MTEEEEIHPFLPIQDYRNPEVISTYDFIYFIQDYSQFLRDYIDFLYNPADNQEEADVNNYFKSFIDICEGINTDNGDDGTFDQRYRDTLEPLMEFMTQSCEDMNMYSEQNAQAAVAQENLELAQDEVHNADAPTGVASRTRSKRPASEFELPPAKRGTNVMTQGPTTQHAVRVKLSDGKEYTYGELKHMWEWNKTMTPYRHPYTEEDKQKITELIDFATKGGKKTRKNKKKTKKTQKSRKNKSKKVKKNKTNNKRRR